MVHWIHRKISELFFFDVHLILAIWTKYDKIFNKIKCNFYSHQNNNDHMNVISNLLWLEIKVLVNGIICHVANIKKTHICYFIRIGLELISYGENAEENWNDKWETSNSLNILKIKKRIRVKTTCCCGSFCLVYRLKHTLLFSFQFSNDEL